MKLRLILSIILILKISSLIAQTDKTDIDIIIEQLTEDAPDDKKQSLILELYELAENPININTDEIENLSSLYILKPEVIRNIKKYIEKNGFISSIFELKLIDGITPNFIKLIAPFISVINPYEKALEEISRVNQEILLNATTTKKKPAPNKEYPGNNWKHCLRYKINIGSQIQAGLLAEKDPGEEFFTGSQQKGFDFYSGYIQINPRGILKQINIGDFKANWGQGLVSWNGFTTGKSSYTIIRGNPSSPLKRYNSTEENRFFRGISLNYALSDKINITPFYSHKKRDAKIIKKVKKTVLSHTDIINTNLPTDETTNNYSVDTTILSDLVNTGYHRTENELRNKHTATESVYGIRLNYSTNIVDIGLNYLKSKTTPPIAQSTGYWQTYYFHGSENSNISIDYKFMFKKIYIFGESAMSKNKAQAHLVGANFHPLNSAELSLVYRKYEKDYQADYSSGFGEYSNTQNEEGLYIGIELQPFKKIKINAYLDYFKFPYKRYCIDTTGSGLEYLVNIEYKASRSIHMYCKYKYEKKPRNYKINRVNTTPDNIKQYLRYNISINPSHNWEFRSRLELSKYTHKDINDNGYMVFQDIFYNTKESALRTQLRFSYFKTDSYNSRIYTYENDLLYSFYSPALYYKGYRTFINTRLRLSRSINLNLKYALSNYKDINKPEAESQKKSEIKIQLRLKL